MQLGIFSKKILHEIMGLDIFLQGESTDGEEKGIQVKTLMYSHTLGLNESGESVLCGASEAKRGR